MDKYSSNLNLTGSSQKYSAHSLVRFFIAVMLFSNPSTSLVASYEKKNKVFNKSNSFTFLNRELKSKKIILKHYL